MIKGGVLHYFSKKATVVVSLSSHLFGPENNCSPSNVRQSILFCPRAPFENKEKTSRQQQRANTHTKNLVLSLPKNSFRWEVQGKWKLNVLINKTLLHVDRYFITVRSNTFHYVLIQSETAAAAGKHPPKILFSLFQKIVLDGKCRGSGSLMSSSIKPCCM